MLDGSLALVCMEMQEDAPFVTVRMRVVKLLGRLGGRVNRSLVTGRETQRESVRGRGVAWRGRGVASIC